MKRTTDIKIDEAAIFAIVDVLLQQTYSSDLVGLYLFYLHQAKEQHSMLIDLSSELAAQSIGWSIDKFRQRKAILTDLKLLENVVLKDDKNNKIVQHLLYLTPWSGLLHGVEFVYRQCIYINNNIIKLNKTYIVPQQKPHHGKPSIIERNKSYIHFAKYLSEIICSNKNANHNLSQIKMWANDIRRLCEQNGIDEKRIQKVLDWYKENIGCQYTPVVESGSSFRIKFLRLEDAMQREMKLSKDKSYEEEEELAPQFRKKYENN